MIKVDQFEGQSVVVLGLGKSGTCTAKALQKSGANVIAWDDSPVCRAEATAAGIPVLDPCNCDWSVISALVLSPGIPHTYPVPHPIVVRAKAAGVALLSDIDLLSKAQKSSKSVGITGTNGKSTTTALIGHIISQTRQPVQVGGNIGIPVLCLDSLGADGIYVLELSSYQLELSRNVAHDISILLNISPDHLARHGGFDGYVASKQLIFQSQRKGQVAVIGIDDPECYKIYESLKATGLKNVIPISACNEIEGGVYFKGGQLVDDAFASHEILLDLNSAPNSCTVKNMQNVAAAYVACRSLGISKQIIIPSLKSFQGLEHRQEKIATIDRVDYINDSKATNEAAVEQALNSYDNIFWILGGRSKTNAIDCLSEYFPKIRHAYLIGESAPTFAGFLEGKLDYTIAGTLENAVIQARKGALASNLSHPIVLLSPACESFDQFNNFEHRGNIFKDIVKALPGLHTYNTKC